MDRALTVKNAASLGNKNQTYPLIQSDEEKKRKTKEKRKRWKTKLNVCY